LPMARLDGFLTELADAVTDDKRPQARIGLIMAVHHDAGPSRVLARRLFRNEFDPIADIVGCFGVGELGMSCGDVGQCECDDLIVTSGAGDIAAFALDLPEHENSSQHTPTSNPRTTSRQC
jgi:hypothetical protein